MMRNNFKFSIAEIIFEINHDCEFVVTNEFLPFISEKENYWELKYHSIQKLPKIEGKIICEYEDYKVIDSGFGLVFYYIERDNHFIYAYSKIDFDQKIVHIYYLPQYQKYFSETGNCLFHSQWEHIMIEEERLFLHASCIDSGLGGILFSGPSGIGKSTQSDLWIKEEGARLINGDRPVIGKKQGKWNAYGSPYAGSSKCHVNEHTEIRCIIMLKQGQHNELRRLTPKQAYRNIYRNLTIHTWNRQFVMKAMDLVAQLIENIPVYEYSCLPNASAVEILKEELERTK